MQVRLPHSPKPSGNELKAFEQSLEARVGTAGVKKWVGSEDVEAFVAIGVSWSSDFIAFSESPSPQ